MRPCVQLHMCTMCRSHAHTNTRTLERAHARARAHTHTHTHLPPAFQPESPVFSQQILALFVCVYRQAREPEREGGKGGREGGRESVKDGWMDGGREGRRETTINGPKTLYSIP